VHLLGNDPTVIANALVAIETAFAPRLKIATAFALVVFAWATAWAERRIAQAPATERMHLQDASTSLKQVPQGFVHGVSPSSFQFNGYGIFNSSRTLSSKGLPLSVGLPWFEIDSQNFGSSLPVSQCHSGLLPPP
jgi:hypothetical protein